MFARRTERLQPSDTKQFKPIISELETAGRKVYKFDHGDVNIPLPAKVIKNIARHFVDPRNYKYASSQGEQKTLELLAKREGVSPDEIVLTAGAKQALYMLATLLFDEGDDVVVLAPYWSTYRIQAELMGANCHILNSKDLMKQLDSFVSKLARPKAIIVNSPNSPSGHLYSRQELDRVVTVAVKHNLNIIADEVYRTLIFDKRSFTSIRALVPAHYLSKVFIVNSPTKAHGMSGFRLGYIVANPEFVKKAIQLNAQSIANVPIFSQYIWADVLADQPGSEAYFEELKARYDVAHKLLRSSGVLSVTSERSTIYLFPRLPKMNMNDTDFCLQVLKSCGVATLPGSAFGASGHIRISIGNATLPDIHEGITLLIQETKKYAEA